MYLGGIHMWIYLYGIGIARRGQNACLSVYWLPDILKPFSFGAGVSHHTVDIRKLMSVWSFLSVNLEMEVALS